MVFTTLYHSTVKNHIHRITINWVIQSIFTKSLFCASETKNSVISKRATWEPLYELSAEKNWLPFLGFTADSTTTFWALFWVLLESDQYLTGLHPSAICKLSGFMCSTMCFSPCLWMWKSIVGVSCSYWGCQKEHIMWCSIINCPN